MDNVVTFENWRISIPALRDAKNHARNSISELFVSLAEYLFTGEASDKAKIDAAVPNVVIIDTSLGINLMCQETTTEAESQSIPFQVNLGASSQDIMNAFGNYLVEANRRLDKLFEDTQDTTDYINKYLEDHGKK